ncbi:helix-turn-helix transcriptional regulator [Bacillus sp. RS11]|uniref:helix-turn-helix transcriptional regulator n=1 Tax=Lysinibacillus sp. RS11 TaxID=3242682 RepID=UPI0035C77393
MNIKEQIQKIDSLEFELFQQKLELVIEKAYLKGVQDGQTKYNYPPVLTKKDLTEIFQASSSTIDRTVARKDFPKLTTLAGKYPRDEVFEWIKNNSI